MSKVGIVMRHLKELKIDPSWFDETVDSVLRSECNRVCNSNKRISFLLANGYTVLELKKLAYRFARTRDKHIVRQMELVSKRKKQKRTNGSSDYLDLAHEIMKIPKRSGERRKSK